VIKPNRPKRGDAVAIVSPSWGGPSLFPGVYENGLAYLRDVLGLRVREFPTARMADDELYRNPKARAEDINAAFADPEIRGIVASIGGDDSVRVLEYLDIPRILANPKVLMGYSDATTLLCYLNMQGLATFYGNSVMAGFSYLAAFPDAAREYESFFLGEPERVLKPFDAWVDRYEPWDDPRNVGKTGPRNLHDRGHRWINTGERRAGHLWGGCMEVLTMMNGTFAWPGREFWDGRVLMVETSEDKPTPGEVGRFLRNLGIQGALGSLAGLLVAKPKGYTDAEKGELDAEILRIVLGEFGRSDMPIVTNVEFGHTDPRHVMPLGIELELDPGAETLTFAESPFA